MNTTETANHDTTNHDAAKRNVAKMLDVLGKDEFECALFDAIVAQLHRLHHDYFYVGDGKGGDRLIVVNHIKAPAKDIARFVEIFG